MGNNGAIQKAAEAKAQAAAGGGQATIQDYIRKMEGEIKKALPSVMTPERFTRIMMSALSANPKLMQCTAKSLLGAMMTAAQLGMEPNTPLGQAYLIPFSNKGIMECQFQLGYKGLMDLAYRSGEVDVIQAHIVHENDSFEYELGLDPKLVHKPARTDRGAAIYVYAMFRTKNGGYGFNVMSVDDIRAHAKKYSKTFNNGPWQTNFEEMAKKTVLKLTLKYAPLKSEFARAVTVDGTVKTDISEDMYTVQTVYVEADAVEVSSEGDEAQILIADDGEVAEGAANE